jgi:formylglycine-generating enzyme required for sulfatase activity
MAARSVASAALLGALLLGGCRKVETTNTRPTPSPSASHSSSIAAPTPPPPPKRGMIWIEPGPLVAGTPPQQLPRLADQEMPGEQVILKGFYIDVFPYPNEEGAIPLTNVTRDGAIKLCGEQEKRLCGELEWERACKGPNNTTFEYGSSYRADRCGTGTEPSLRPSGLRVACRSEFGVRDMHGGAFEWTQSAWGRGTEAGFFAVRGGNGPHGELTGRCANAEPRLPGVSAANVGFRCCAGPQVNTEVVLDMRRGPKLEAKGVVEKELSRLFLAALPDDGQRQLRRFGEPRVEMFWIWRPIANEELHVARICAGLGKQPSCGLLFVRLGVAAPDMLGWAESGFVPGSLHIEREPRELWILGGDDPGPFKRFVSYSWGRISIGPIERHVAKPRKKTKRG